MQHHNRVALNDVLSLAREAFISCNFESALRYAIAAARMYPDSSEAYAYVAAYRIHHAAATKKTVTGETDWYAVMGIDQPTVSMDLIYDHYCDKEELLNDVGVEEFPGWRGASNLIKTAMAVLEDFESKRAYDLRGWPWMSVQSVWAVNWANWA